MGVTTALERWKFQPIFWDAEMPPPVEEVCNWGACGLQNEANETALLGPLYA